MSAKELSTALLTVWTVVEMNLKTVEQLRTEGVVAVYGDATLRDTLRTAGVHKAGTLILSASGLRGSEEVIRLANTQKIAIVAV